MRIRKAHVLPLLCRIGPPGKRVLDAGAGRGDYAFYLSSRFPDARVTAVELDERKVEMNQLEVKRRGIDNLEFLQGDLVELRLPYRFDLIYSIDVFEHIQDDIRAFQSLYDVMNEGGLLVIHVPLAHRRPSLTPRYEYRVQADHVRDGYEEDDLIQKIERAGFRLVEKKYTFGTFGTAAWEIYQLAGEVSRILQWLTIIPTMCLTSLEIRLRNPRGNGLLVVACRSISK